MSLTKLNVVDFTKELASDAPAPGGGSAAALTGGLGIALTNMVASLTVGKKRYEEFEDLNQEVLKESEKLREKLVNAMDKDVEVFNANLTPVYSMPRGTDEEKEKRSIAFEEASKACTVVPFEIMELCLESLRLTDRMIGKSNISARSDIGVAALNLKAGIQAAWLNVIINLGGIKDEDFVDDYKTRGEEMLKEALPLADKIYEAIKDTL